MPRTLPGGLAAIISGSSQQPSLSATTEDPRTRFSLKVSTGQTAARSHAILTSAGTILLATVGQAADPQSVKIYRITDPTQNSQWTAAALATLSANAHNAAGCCLVQTGSAIRCFWIDRTAKQPKYCESTNDGATWGAVTAAGPGSAPLINNLTYGIAAVSTTDLYVLYADYAQDACLLERTQYSGGSWGAWASVGPASPVWGGVRGLMVEPALSTKVFAGGVQMRVNQSGFASSFATFDGATWSAWIAAADMDTPSNGLSLMYPSVHYDAGTSTYFAAVTLTDDGSVSGTAATRTTFFTSTDGLTWSIASGLAAAFTYEAHVLIKAGITYAFDNVNVYTAPVPPAPLDISNDILSLQVTESGDEHRSFVLTLANQASQYFNLSTLKDNARIKLSLGYNASTVYCFDCYVDALRYQARGDEIDLVITGRGVTKFLDQISPRFTALVSKTVAQLAQTICAYAGVNLAALPATSQFSQVVPSFSITAGESWYTALKRLSQVYQFDLLESPPSTVKITERSASDPSNWTYGSETLAVASQLNADQPNIIRVVGASTGGTNIFAEVTDGPNLSASGVHRFELVVDRMLDTSAKCLLRAQLELRDAKTLAQTAALTVALNPAHELMDVITVTDPRVNWSAQTLRIHAIHTHVDFQSGLFHQDLSCQLP